MIDIADYKATRSGVMPPTGKPTMGAHAMGLGAVMANCRYFCGYPITPQTELLEYVSQELPKIGGLFQQMSDEIASIMALHGAAGTGARVMTASVGPGLTLMIDGLANAAGAELPMVLGAITRAHVGVSAGLLPAQSDIRMLLGGGNGDYHLPIFAPAGVTEAAQLTLEAFDLADYYRTPVVVAIDGFMSNMIETLMPFEARPRELPGKNWTFDHPLSDGKRFVAAFKSSEIDTYMTYKLQAKYRKMEAEETRCEEFLLDDAEFVVVAFGIMARVAKEAIRRARKKGIKVGLFRPITLYPFPEARLNALARTVKEILVTEMNFGQVLPDVRLAANGQCPIQFLGQPANPIPPARLTEAIEAVARGEKVRPIEFMEVHPNGADIWKRMDARGREDMERYANERMPAVG